VMMFDVFGGSTKRSEWGSVFFNRRYTSVVETISGTLSTRSENDMGS